MIFMLCRCSTRGSENRLFLSEAMDIYYRDKEADNRIRQKRQQLTRLLSKAIAHVGKNRDLP